jgi:hypothetical protein
MLNHRQCIEPVGPPGAYVGVRHGSRVGPTPGAVLPDAAPALGQCNFYKKMLEFLVTFMQYIGVLTEGFSYVCDS